MELQPHKMLHTISFGCVTLEFKLTFIIILHFTAPKAAT